MRLLSWAVVLCLALWPVWPGAETIRIATYAAPLHRDGPGLLLRDLLAGDDPQIAAILAVINAANPDVLVLTNFDFDHDGLALAAFAALVDPPYPYHFSRRPNTGMATGFDLDRDGRRGDPRDAQGYGDFAGQAGMAILSRFPIAKPAVRDLSALLWRDLPGAVLPVQADGAAYFTPEERAHLRLSTTGHWIVPVQPGDGPGFAVLAWSATPPAFDGAERRNVLRNRDELRLWEHVLAGRIGDLAGPFVLAGNANLDPAGGDGLRGAMRQFLADPRLQDPLPGYPTADWTAQGIGRLRVSYVLPSRDWQVAAARIVWPAPAETGAHHLVWVDLVPP